MLIAQGPSQMSLVGLSLTFAAIPAKRVLSRRHKPRLDKERGTGSQNYYLQHRLGLHGRLAAVPAGVASSPESIGG